MHSGIALLAILVVLRRATRSHHANHKRQLRSIQILADIADKMSQHLGVIIIATRLIALRINILRHHVIPPLEPNDPGKLHALFRIIPRMRFLGIT